MQPNTIPAYLICFKTLTSFGSVKVKAYHSIDVTGWFTPDTTGDYSFQVNYKQRYQLDANGQSMGKLEMHNPGMCWYVLSHCFNCGLIANVYRPQWHTDTTKTMTLNAGSWYPIRMRYQSGCGGGEFRLRLCDNGNCQPLNVLNVATEQVTDFPVTVRISELCVSVINTVGLEWIYRTGSSGSSICHRFTN